ncbi:myristylated protein [Brazilian porcupinepox virus 1]|nr:myristylated protein [Brazilian porcupinepox virus 1]
MGSSYTIPEEAKSKPLKPKPTSEMNIDVDDMYNLISSLVIIYDTVYIGRVKEEKKKLLRKTFPEFLIGNSGPGNLSSIIRTSYTNDKKRCCRDIKLRNYWVDKDGNISNTFKKDSILNSCDYSLHDKGYCDDELFNWCQKKESDTNICNKWLYSLLTREYPPSNNMLNNLTGLCSKNADTPFCESFLHNLRVRNSESTDNIIDYILLSQSDEFKNKNMKCSYPTESKIEESLKYSEVRECWDPECENANLNFLLSKNYKNLGLCTIDRCNVSINHLDMDKKSKVRMSCGLRYNNNNNKLPVNIEKVVMHNIDNSFNLRFREITLLYIIIIWILIVAI